MSIKPRSLIMGPFSRYVLLRLFHAFTSTGPETWSKFELQQNIVIITSFGGSFSDVLLTRDCNQGGAQDQIRPAPISV